jgi:hypothetical protein
MWLRQLQVNLTSAGCVYYNYHHSHALDFISLSLLELKATTTTSETYQLPYLRCPDDAAQTAAGQLATSWPHTFHQLSSVIKSIPPISCLSAVS